MHTLKTIILATFLYLLFFFMICSSYYYSVINSELFMISKLFLTIVFFIYLGYKVEIFSYKRKYFPIIVLSSIFILVSFLYSKSQMSFSFDNLLYYFIIFSSMFFGGFINHKKKTN